MEGRTAQQFLNDLSCGLEQTVSYRGETFFIEGYVDGEDWVAHLDKWEPGTSRTLWSCRDKSMEACLEKFIGSPLFDGQTFWQAQGEMTVLSA